MPMPAGDAPERAVPRHQPSPRKVEVLFKLVAPGSCGNRPTRRGAHHRESLLPVLCRPSHRNRDLRTSEATASRTSGLARRLPSRVPHNATDEGSKKNPHQSRLSALLLVFWLTSAIHRIFKEPLRQRLYSTSPPHRRFKRSAEVGQRIILRGRLIEGSFEPTDTIGRCKLPAGISPRPVISASLLREVKVILTSPRPRSITRSIFLEIWESGTQESREIAAPSDVQDAKSTRTQ